MRTTWLTEQDRILPDAWRDLPRGTRSKIVGPLRLDVWCIADVGWRWTIDRSGVYLSYGTTETEAQAKAQAEGACLALLPIREDVPE